MKQKVRVLTVKIKTLLNENFFAYLFLLSYVQTTSDGRKKSKQLKLGFFRALKCSYFVLKKFRENSQLTLTSPVILCYFILLGVEKPIKSCPIAMYTYLQEALPRLVMHRTQVRNKWKLPVRFSSTKKNRVYQTKISTRTAVFRSRSEQKTPVTKLFVRCVCVLFSVAKSILE